MSDFPYRLERINNKWFEWLLDTSTGDIDALIELHYSECEVSFCATCTAIEATERETDKQ